MTTQATNDDTVSNGKDSTTSALKDRAAKAMEEGLETAKVSADEVTKAATAELQRMSESGTKFVRENPMTSLLGAVGVGILIGVALRGRD